MPSEGAHFGEELTIGSDDDSAAAAAAVEPTTQHRRGVQAVAVWCDRVFSGAGRVEVHGGLKQLLRSGTSGIFSTGCVDRIARSKTMGSKTLRFFQKVYIKKARFRLPDRKPALSSLQVSDGIGISLRREVELAHRGGCDRFPAVVFLSATLSKGATNKSNILFTEGSRPDFFPETPSFGIGNLNLPVLVKKKTSTEERTHPPLVRTQRYLLCTAYQALHY